MSAACYKTPVQIFRTQISTSALKTSSARRTHNIHTLLVPVPYLLSLLESYPSRVHDPRIILQFVHQAFEAIAPLQQIPFHILGKKVENILKSAIKRLSFFFSETFSVAFVVLFSFTPFIFKAVQSHEWR